MENKVTMGPSNEEPEDLAQTEEALGLTECAEDLTDREFAEQLLVCARAIVEESANDMQALMEEALARFDPVEITRTLGDIGQIADGRVLVREGKCPRCNRLEGEAHKLGACIAFARVVEIRERLARV
jgi:hypothetical protein